jgi:hypothetical protein
LKEHKKSLRKSVDESYVVDGEMIEPQVASAVADIEM